MNPDDEIRLVLSKRQIKALLFLALVLGGTYALMSESLTLTTYYPAPSGVYNKMITTDAAYLARDGGNVGVGTTAPGAKLEVAGNAIAEDPALDPHLVTLRYLKQYVAAQIAAIPTPAPAPKDGGQYTFGTSYCGGGCFDVNPLTGACSCPPGFKAEQGSFYYSYSCDAGHGSIPIYFYNCK